MRERHTAPAPKVPAGLCFWLLRTFVKCQLSKTVGFTRGGVVFPPSRGTENVSDNTEKMATEFVLKTLKKRLFSSPAAFAATLDKHEQSLRTAKRRKTTTERPSVAILQRQIDRLDEEYGDDAAAEEAADDAVDTATRLFREPTAEELALLKQMKAWAATAVARTDSKAQELIRWLAKTLRPNGKWTNNRVIVFSEYRATQNWLQTVLATEGFSGGDRLMTMYGGMDSDQREAVKAAFQASPDVSPVRILLATELRAEVWSTEGKKRLLRVAARLVPDTVLRDPAMIAHARLVVIGGDSHRLHEEIITAGGVLREGRFTRMKVGEVQDALAAMKAEQPAKAMKETLLGLYPKHADSLRQALEARMKDRTTGLQKALAERAAKEAADITAILTELQRSIQEKLHDPELRQLTFAGWEDEERQQLERNMNALRVRVREIPDEIKRETAAVTARFADPQPRMFPVAVTFLVPEKMARG